MWVLLVDSVIVMGFCVASENPSFFKVWIFVDAAKKFENAILGNEEEEEKGIAKMGSSVSKKKQATEHMKELQRLQEKVPFDIFHINRYNLCMLL